MSEFTVSTFGEAVARYFGPIAHEHDWQLIRRSDDAFDIRTPYSVVRLSSHQGRHTRSMNAVLAPAKDEPEGETGIGIWSIAGYNGVKFQYIPWEQTAEGFFEEAEYLAGMVKTFCLPYMLGEKSDWEDLREHRRRETEKAVEKVKGYKFPSFVQKRWHLPPPPKPSAG